MAVKKKTAKVLESDNFAWTVGTKAVKIFHGLSGYREARVVEITSIDTKTRTIYVDNETGITYDVNGREKENFIPGMRSEITPLEL
jgi:hypothetical protein